MSTISLCMIVKNEESTLERCLNSVNDFVDEIIIVDTGSSDRTKEIAYLFTDKVFDFVWIDDFSAARNFSFELATMDYIMWLDADDVILHDDAIKIINLKQSISDKVDIVMMKYNTAFDEQGRVIFSCFRERLVKRSRGYKWKEPVHEYLEIYGNIVNSDIGITHAKVNTEKNSRNIQIYESLLNEGKKLSSRGQYYYARELKDHQRYKEAIKWFSLFLDSKLGWIEDNISACVELSTCYQMINDNKASIESLFHSFNFDVPRAEVCCQIGYYFKKLNNYRLAAFWFNLVLNLEKNTSTWGFTRDDCLGFIPCIECALCYDKLGEYKKASEYNDMAAEYKPYSTAVLHNKQYFNARLEKIKN